MSLLKILEFLKSRTSPQTVAKIRKYQSLQFRSLQHYIYSLLLGDNLKVLAIIYGTDKWGAHWYAQHYATHFRCLRKKKLNILEIGVGGYDKPDAGGASLRMWRAYFPRARIFGIDLYDKTIHEERRIKIFKGSQIDLKFLQNVIDEIGPIDIVIDDGSHISSHIIETFNFIFPRMSSSGFYVIEDLHTSYRSNYNGSTDHNCLKNTVMDLLKNLVDGLNYSGYENQNYVPNYFDLNIKALHFYPKLVFVEKGANSG